MNRPTRQSPLARNSYTPLSNYFYRNNKIESCQWKPWTLRAPTLSALILVSLLLATAIEILAQKSIKEGGLSLSESIDSIPQTSLLASNYLPTLIAIIYSLLWSWVDLDAKRIQPWLELSKKGGSTAQNSLFLDYPFEFLAFVPFRAARRGHWPVFYVGTIIMIVFWLITPLQSSIFGVGSISLTRPVSVLAPTPLAPIADQTSLLDIGILNDAFAITWLGQPFPSSMTADYALLPFKANSAMPSFATSAYLTSWTWQLTTELNCWPATVNGSGASFRVNNGRGCEVNIGFFGSPSTPQDIQYSMLYVGYYANDYLDYFLEGPSCAKNSSHQFLAISAARNGTADKVFSKYKSITALFCQPQYSKRNVSVALSRDTLSPVETSIVPNGDYETLLDSEFNTTAFEYLLGTGRPPVTLVRDYPKVKTLEQYPQLVDNRIEWPITNMVGFAIGSQNYSAEELHDPAVLAAAYTRAHKSLFSATIAQLLSNGTGISPVSQAGSIQYTTYGVIVSRPISAVVEALLLVVAILAGCTLYHCARYRSLLTSDPSSISDILGMIQCSESALLDFADQDRSDDATLREHMEGNSYFLQEKSETSKISLCLDKSENTRSTAPRQNWPHSFKRGYKPIRPSALSSVAGASFTGVLLIGIVTLAYLKQQEKNLGGLTPPSSNFEVMQLLENYIPTVFATLLEPFWVLLNRIYCILQPFSELQKGRSLPRHSVLAKYTSIPPQLVIWRSAKARQYLLMFVCLATLLANILALSLSGVFNDMPRVVTYNAMAKPVRVAIPSRDDLVPRLSSLNPYSDHFEVVMANLSSKTSLPPWTDNSNFYLPFSQPENEVLAAGDQFKATTLGFGIEFQCSPIHLNDLSGNAAVTLSSTNSSEIITLSARLPNGSYAGCNYKQSSPFLYHLPPGKPSAREVILGPINNLMGDLCWSKAPWLAGWMRVHPTQQKPGNQTLRSTFLNCQSSLRVAMFDVTVDTDSNVIDAAKLGDPGANLKNWSTTLSQSITDQVARINGYPTSSEVIWHNETVTTDWMNHLLTLMMGNRSLVDPAQEVPDSTTMRPILEDLYQRLAATLFGLNPSFFQDAAEGMDPIPATLTRTESRIFLSEPAFIVSISILAIYLLISVAVYVRGRDILLPRMPSSLGSLLAYSVASQAVEDFSERYETGDDSILSHTYTFGKYIGKDGKPHVGIERDPFVIKLDRGSLKKG